MVSRKEKQKQVVQVQVHANEVHNEVVDYTYVEEGKERKNNKNESFLQVVLVVICIAVIFMVENGLKQDNEQIVSFNMLALCEGVIKLN